MTAPVGFCAAVGFSAVELRNCSVTSVLGEAFACALVCHFASTREPFLEGLSGVQWPRTTRSSLRTTFEMSHDVQMTV